MTAAAPGDESAPGPGSVAITWWGHATTTIELGGRRILTDPVLTRRVAHLSRLGGPVPEAAARRCDAVVISHLHLDHLHRPSLRTLDPQTPIIGPLGCARILRARTRHRTRRIEEVAPGDVVGIGGVRIRAVPAAHDGRRSPVSRHHGPALGFVLEPTATAAPRVWFAGDTGLFEAMTDIGPVDVAVVPIGGWGPSLGPTHLDPARAAEAVHRVGARDAIAVHYGTLWPTGLRRLYPAGFRRWFLDPAPTFVGALAARCPETRAHVIPPGQTVRIAARAEDAR